MISRSGVDTFELDDETLMKQIQAYTITSFDSGSYRIPPYWFKIDVDGTIDSIPSNGVTLNVYNMQIDTTKGPTDIKMPYGAPLTLKEVTPYILGVILIGAIIFFSCIRSNGRKTTNQYLHVRRSQKSRHILLHCANWTVLKRKKFGKKAKQNSITASLPTHCANTLKIVLPFEQWSKLPTKR